MPKCEVFAFDINSSAQRLCRQLAVLNGVEDRVRAGGRCSTNDLQRLAGHESVLICDVEGAEGDLLNPASAPALRETTIIVELHDCLAPGVSDVVRRHFAATHHCEEVFAADRRIDALPELGAFTPAECRLMVSEFRVPGQSWLRLRPNRDV